MSVHIKPIRDLRQHTGMECWCDPRVEWLDETGLPYGNGPLVVHNSADGRERLEEVGVLSGKWGVYQV